MSKNPATWSDAGNAIRCMLRKAHILNKWTGKYVYHMAGNVGGNVFGGFIPQDIALGTFRFC